MYKLTINGNEIFRKKIALNNNSKLTFKLKYLKLLDDVKFNIYLDDVLIESIPAHLKTSFKISFTSNFSKLRSLYINIKYAKVKKFFYSHFQIVFVFFFNNSSFFSRVA